MNDIYLRYFFMIKYKMRYDQVYLNGLPYILARFIFGLIPMDISYWNNSLQAYGILTWYTDFPLQFLQTFEYLKNPHPSQISTVVSSLEYKSLSNNISLPPYPKRQSLSISPNLNPPSLLLPYVGCLVRIVTLPTERAWILSATMCFSLW